MKNYIYKFLFLLAPLFVFSQGKLIKGTVNDNNGNPLPGATIQVKGSDNIGAITDFDGKFSLTLSSTNSNIVISYIGFISQEVDVTNQSAIVISLQQDISELQEVVVVGYGTVLKSDLTGAVSSVKVDENLSRQINSIDQLIQGRAAGVQVTQSAGNPNAGVSVRIRGTNSLRGNNEPLYVIDGIIVSSAAEDNMQVDQSTGNTGQDVQSGLNGINPRDIENIEVLKDASATAIYGSRGANGVVLITTKSGVNEGDKGKINVFNNVTLSSIYKTYDVLDGVGYAEYQNATQELAGNTPRFLIQGDQVYSYRLDTDGNVSTSPNDVPLTIRNWQDEIYNTSVSSNVGVSFSDGNDKGNFYISAGVSDQQGIVKTSSFNTADLRLNLDYKLSKKSKVTARMSAFLSNSDFSAGGDKIGGDRNFVQQLVGFRPLVNNNPDIIIDDNDLGVGNPLTFIEDFTDNTSENRIFASLAYQYDFNINGLQYELRLGGNLRAKNRERFFGNTTWQGSNVGGLFQKMTLNSLTYQINNLLRYNKKFNSNHRLNAVAGVTYDVRDVENTTYAVSDFITQQLGSAQPFLGQVVSSPLFVAKADQQIFSVLGRFNYTFKNKYTLTSSFRYDGVSKFAPGKRYGFFPSFALAWRAVGESFIRDLDVFSNLKVRAGWGEIGNHGINPYGTLPNYGAASTLYGSPSGGTVVPLVLNNIPNPNLTWETTEQFNFGIDFGILNGKVSGSIDLYDKTTKDLLQQAPIPTSSGFQQLVLNRGSMSNKGVELLIDISAINTPDFNLSFGGNIAFNRTRIENLGLPTSDLLMKDGDGYTVQQRSYYNGNRVSRGNSAPLTPMNIFIEGEESALFYGWKTDGLFQESDELYSVNGSMAQPGDIKPLDLNGDGVVDQGDMTVIGNPNPDFTYGFNVNMNYKRFSLNLLFNGVHGNDIVNANLYRFGMAQGNFRNILSDAWYKRWTPDNPDTTFPRLNYQTDRFVALMDNAVEDGSFLRLKNISLNYDVNVDSLSFVDAANLTLTGVNMLTWTNYSGYDPEITAFLWDGMIQGTDWNNNPNVKSVIIGLNIEF